jgi:hypothetical protein
LQVGIAVPIAVSWVCFASLFDGAAQPIAVGLFAPKMPTISVFAAASVVWFSAAEHLRPRAEQPDDSLSEFHEVVS